MDDILGDLRRLRHYAAGLQELMDEVERAAPERSEGTDHSGMISAVLGRDGLPETVRVSSMWQDRLTPEAFGAAVTEACQAAMAERGTVWSQALERAGWQQRLDRLEADSDAAAAADSSPVPAAFRRATESVQPRPLDELAEEAMRALDAATAAAPRARAEPARGTGTNAEHTLAITVSEGGQVSCQADAGWVSQRTAAQLGQALGAALAAARQDLATAAEAGRAGGMVAGVQPGQLMIETLAALDRVARPGKT